jgi:hypothetical protein
VAGDWHATDAVGSRVQLKTTNNSGVHQLHVVSDALTPGASSKLAFTGTSAQSSAIAGTIVRVTATQNCHLAFGANPTAVADGSCVYLPAGQTQFFAVTSGNKIAAIQDSAGGNLFITVMS